MRYLSQQFVERLCAADGVSDHLLNEIERVVFASIPPGDRQGATDFRELLEVRLQHSRDRQRDELEAIESASERITDERILTRSVVGRREEIEEDEKALGEVNAKINQLTEKGDRASAERLDEVTNALEKRVRLLEDLERTKTDLDGLLGRLARLRSTALPRVATKLREEYPRAGLSDDEWIALTPELPTDAEAMVRTSLERTSDQASAIRHGSAQTAREDYEETLDDYDMDGLLELSVDTLTHEQKRLEAAVGLDKRRASNLKQLSDRASALRTKLEKALRDLDHAEGAAERGKVLRSKREDHYAAYFDALLQEEEELRQLYQPLQEILQAFGSSAAKLRLAVKRKVEVEEWARLGEALLDLRVGGRFKGAGELLEVAQTELLAAWQSGDGEEAAEAIGVFSAEYSKDLREQSKARAGDIGAYREWERAVNRWLYSAEHVTLTYTLTYDRVGIERLSPGARGIVLLLLYLAVDQTETDPLIIDQPEENLDPESVYSELVRLFREASNRRQIIMVTHNANLVVNTDVDQVIVASSRDFDEGRLPRLEYMAGGLESPQIRSAVCQVLEGGSEAFRQRARRLRITI